MHWIPALICLNNELLLLIFTVRTSLFVASHDNSGERASGCESAPLHQQ